MLYFAHKTRLAQVSRLESACKWTDFRRSSSHRHGSNHSQRLCHSGASLKWLGLPMLAKIWHVYYCFRHSGKSCYRYAVRTKAKGRALKSIDIFTNQEPRAQSRRRHPDRECATVSGFHRTRNATGRGGGFKRAVSRSVPVRNGSTPKSAFL